MDQEQEVEELAAELAAMREAYYNLSPVAPDQTYDAKKERLRQLAPSHPEVAAVGAPPPRFSVWEKVRHEIPMGSLEKVNTREEFAAWAAGTGANYFLITHKIDGSSMELVYLRGKLLRCVTRGDGAIGEDVVHNVSQIPSVPKELPAPVDAVVRGEVVMRKEVFQSLYAEQYANPRNTAAGKVRDKKGGGADCQNLDFIAYQVDPQAGVDTMLAVFLWLRKRGFQIPAFYGCGTAADMDSAFEASRAARDSVPYEIDGMVISVNDLAALEELGDHNMRPRGQIAWKYNAAMAETRMLDVKWQVGPSGRITPVAVVEPMEIGGVTVTNVSLHNLSMFRDLHLSKGCRVIVARRGDIIPYIEKNLDADA